MEPHAACPLPPYPAFERRYPRAWFLKMEAHFFVCRIDSRTERYRITTTLLPADLRCEPLKHGERPYDTLQAYVMARLGSSLSRHRDAESPPSTVTSRDGPHDGMGTVLTSLQPPSPPEDDSPTQKRRDVLPPPGFTERHSTGHTTPDAPSHSTPPGDTTPLNSAALPPRPPFYPKNFEVWLCQVECFYDLYGVTAQQDRYSLMYELLPSSLTSTLPEPGAQPYDELRTILLARYGRYLKPPAPDAEPPTTPVEVVLPRFIMPASTMLAHDDTTATATTLYYVDGSSEATTMNCTSHSSSPLPNVSALPPRST